ncbi:MAG: SagB family peptide dehydrogenase [Nakamurella sp.]
MTIPLKVRLRTEVQRTTMTLPGGGESEVLAARWAALPLPRAGTPERAPVELLLKGPTAPAELDKAAATEGTTGLARWILWAAKARERALICYRLHSRDGAVVADLVPTAPDASNLMLETSSSPMAIRVQLSRLAVLHRGRRGMVLDSPGASMRVELANDAAAAIAAFAVPVSTVDLAGALRLTPAFGATEAHSLLSVLLKAGLLAEVGEDGLLAEDRDAVLSQWELPDLLLHARTRTARQDEPRGGTYRFAEVRAAPPAVKHAFLESEHSSSADRIILEPPDLAALMSTDPPLARVMEDRVSGRSLGRLTVGQLSEFCYRSMRVRTHRQTGDGAHHYSMTSRPYPSAGGMYEFTTYLAVDDCQGLTAGLYRYDPIDHGLDRLAASNPDVERLLLEGGRAANLTTPPPVLVILAADFRRLSWKYEGIAYALTLKNAGVLLGMMQLVATAMRLESCPVGTGDSDLFARAAGTRALEESSVGEFLLGS